VERRQAPPGQPGRAETESGGDAVLVGEWRAAPGREGTVSLTRPCLPPSLLLLMLALYGVGVLALWGIGPGPGRITCLVAVGRGLWHLFHRETWLVANNALEVRHHLFGLSWGRRFVGGTLIIARHSQFTNRRQVRVTERGRSRRLSIEDSDGEAGALTSFVGAHTGWPVVRQ